MLQFVDYSYDQLKAHIHLIKRNPFLCNDISVGSIFIWSHGVDFQFAVYHNTLILKETIGDQTVFSYPFGDDVEGALRTRGQGTFPPVPSVPCPVSIKYFLYLLVLLRFL